MATMKDDPVKRTLRDAKICEIGEGTSEILRLIIARQLLGRQPLGKGVVAAPHAT